MTAPTDGHSRRRPKLRRSQSANYRSNSADYRSWSHHHRAFIARRRALRPGEEYRDLTPEEWDLFLHHFELRKVALGICTRDFGTPCVHEHSCVRCPQLRPDPGQEPRLTEIRGNLQARIAEARREGWLGEVAGLEATLAAADQKLQAMKQIASRHRVTHLGMPDFRDSVGRASDGLSRPPSQTDRHEP